MNQFRRSVVVGLGLAWLAGCLPTYPKNDGVEKNSVNDPRNSKQITKQTNRIEISAGSSSGVAGGPTWRAEWAIEKGKPGTVTVTHGTNTNNALPRTSKMTIPAEKYDDLQRLLEEVDFFNIRAKQPGVAFESTTSSIRVNSGGRTHFVSVVSPAPSPNGYDKLLNYLADVSKFEKKPEFVEKKPDTVEKKPENIEGFLLP